MASSVGLIISVTPFFTVILSHLFTKSEGKLKVNFFIGFVVAMVGVALISFNGSKLELNPMGNVLVVFGLCAVFIEKKKLVSETEQNYFGIPILT